MIFKFPADFLWGAATSSYQVEGRNVGSDWWKIESALNPETAESGGADHYRMFREDYTLASSLGLNAQRLSVEWSRIEKEEGNFDQKEIDYYKEVLSFIKERRMKIFLTLHHFSNPLWFEGKGGWLNLKEAKFYFRRFAELCVREFSPFVDAFITINEPNLYSCIYPIRDLERGPLALGKGTSLEGPTFVKVRPLQATRIYENLLKVHQDAYKIIKAISPSTPVGLALNVPCFDSFNNSLINKFAAEIIRYLNDLTIRGVLLNCSDFIGLNYYFHLKVKFNPLNPERFVEFYNGNSVMSRLGIHGSQSFFNLAGVNQGDDYSDIGWETFPEGLYRVLIDLNKYGKPIYVTENGISDARDVQREEYLKSHLESVVRAINSGCNVQGYFYWSLIDNFEWSQGYKPRFGLLEVDYRSKERRIRKSASFLSETARTNSLNL